MWIKTRNGTHKTGQRSPPGKPQRGAVGKGKRHSRNRHIAWPLFDVNAAHTICSHFLGVPCGSHHFPAVKKTRVGVPPNFPLPQKGRLALPKVYVQRPLFYVNATTVNEQKPVMQSVNNHAATHCAATGSGTPVRQPVPIPVHRPARGPCTAAGGRKSARKSGNYALLINIL
jgi:hypothetical protein